MFTSPLSEFSPILMNVMYVLTLVTIAASFYLLITRHTFKVCYLISSFVHILLFIQSPLAIITAIFFSSLCLWLAQKVTTASCLKYSQLKYLEIRVLGLWCLILSISILTMNMSPDSFRHIGIHIFYSLIILTVIFGVCLLYVLNPIHGEVYKASRRYDLDLIYYPLFVSQKSPIILLHGVAAYLFRLKQIPWSEAALNNPEVLHFKWWRNRMLFDTPQIHDWYYHGGIELCTTLLEHIAHIHEIPENGFETLELPVL